MATSILACRRQRQCSYVFIAAALMVTALGLGRVQAQPQAEKERLRTTASAGAALSDDAAKAPALEAEITEVTGKNTQLSRDGGQSWQQAKKSDKLSRGHLIRTGFTDSCELSFGEHSMVQIQPLSAVRVTDYTGTARSATVRAHLQYGAVRCGVTKGRIKADTRISTPVSTLSIRGTLVYVEYDPGTLMCLLQVDEDGPALAGVAGGCKDCRKPYTLAEPNRVYPLDEGMKTDCALSRYLKLAVFERTLWVTGNQELTEITGAEADAIVYTEESVLDPTDGSNQYNDDRSRSNQRVSGEVIDYNEGDIPIGDITPPYDEQPD